MNTKEDNNTTNQYATDWERELNGKNFEELAKIIANKQDYNPDFIIMAEQKLKQHSDYNEVILEATIESEKNKRREKEEEEEKRMSGWLQLFMAGLAIVSTITLYRSLMAISLETYGYVLPLMWSDITTAIGLAILAGYAFVALYKRWINAIHLTYFYLGVCVILNLIALFKLADTTNPLENIDFYRPVWGIVIAVIWWLYFKNAKRIKARYPQEKREWFKRDKYILGAVIVVPIVLLLWGMFSNPSTPSLSVADGIDVTEVDQSSYLIDESKLNDDEITDGMIIIKVPKGTEYEQLSLDDGTKLYELSNKKDNPDYVDYVIRVASQGYVGTGDIVFEDIWMQFLDNNMKDIPYQVIRDDMTNIEFGKCYRKVVKYKTDVDMVLDFTLLHDLGDKKACLLTSYYREGVKAPIDEVIKGIRFRQK